MKIKQGLEEKYKEYLTKNVAENCNEDDLSLAYTLEILLSTELVGMALDDGKTPADAMEETKGRGLTGYMAGCVSSAIYKYHSKGEEFKQWWNQGYGADPKAEGIVNPALVTIKGNDTKE